WAIRTELIVEIERYVILHVGLSSETRFWPRFVPNRRTAAGAQIASIPRVQGMNHDERARLGVGLVPERDDADLRWEERSPRHPLSGWRAVARRDLRPPGAGVGGELRLGG